uniref:Major facilitator superfamily (MFS) profile domain-containing protein n=1 Tax=Chrysotila carterae TaxID=13221 RepID=A0A7S4F0N0_CHRCT|mmetsp:Transcript_33265/g.64145  ORF Transcript_33265/g.64145 Transcript_33265/m.64145 type:complete len:224 (-) Transcript_33265:338-1009(-)
MLLQMMLKQGGAMWWLSCVMIISSAIGSFVTQDHAQKADGPAAVNCMRPKFLQAISVENARATLEGARRAGCLRGTRPCLQRCSNTVDRTSADTTHAKATASSRGVAVQASLHLRGGGGMRDALAEQFPLQSLALVFVLGLALVTLTPTPFLVDQLGAARGMRLLTILSTSSAAAEILLSPVAGTLTDSVGRKPVLLASLLTAFAATAGAAAMPTVAMISASK